jgi:hypothetical protein
MNITDWLVEPHIPYLNYISNTRTRNRLSLWQIYMVMSFPGSNSLVHFSSSPSESAQSSFLARNSRHIYLAQTLIVPSIPSRVMPKVDSDKPCSLQVTVPFDTEPLNTISRAMEVIKFTSICWYTCISFVDFVILNDWSSTEVSISCCTNTKRF